MRPIVRALVSMLLAAAAFAGEQAKPETQPQSSVVSIPLSQYEQLRSTSENAAATVVDTLMIAGTFHDRNLQITITGRSVGARAAVAIIRDATDVTLSGCSGDALIMRAGKGTFQLVALGSSFTLRCDVRLSGSDRLQMNVQPSVLAVRSAVTDGELVAGDEDKDGVRTFTLVRQVVGTGETLATTATGRYLITLLPDASRFRYTIQVHNPNRATSPLPLKLVSSEHLQQIDSSAPYEIKDGSYTFAMPPGDSTITLSGELRGASFAPPVAASLQYAVIESHPLLRPVFQSGAQSALKRVSTGETGITTQYRGAVAFEIGPNERISWNVTRLEALRAISYAVRHTSHTFFVPANGPILGESELQIENQGAPELMLPPKPEPTYVSLGDEPVLMTKNRDGELTVPLSSGSQRVVVQHRQSVAHWGVVLARLDVPRVSVPATYTDVTLRYPDHWLPLWQSFATEATLWRPDTGVLLLFVLFAVWIERVLGFLSVSASRRIAAAAILAFAAMLIPTVLWITVASCLGLTVLWIAANRKNLSALQVVGVLAVIVVGLLIVIAVPNLTPRRVAKYEAVQRSEETANTSTAVTDTTATVPPQTPERKESNAYQGLPAKFDLPSGARNSSFRQEMLAADRPQNVRIVLLSMTLVTWFAVAATFVAAWLLWRERAVMKARLSDRFAAATAPTPSSPTA